MVKKIFLNIIKFLNYLFGSLLKGKKVPVKKKEQEEYELKRSEKNPIISPSAYLWEEAGTFNPAAVCLAGRVHLLYRAMGHDGRSVLGYASSPDGIDFDERLPYPVFVPSAPFEIAAFDSVPKEFQKYSTHLYHSGGGWCGCEDPKITFIEEDGRLYLTYVAFAGWHSVRIAMSSISVEDFLAKRWNWDSSVAVTPSDVTAKSGGLFPEKIKGKYVFFQRVMPNVLLDFVEKLEFKKEEDFLQGRYSIPPREDQWDSGKFSFGAPPIKTKLGWLVIYHATTGRHEWAGSDLRYKIGAMILDSNDPTRVLYRSNSPIIVPEMWYENDGKPGIVYPCGAVVINGTLFVYYGGGDRHVCVATANLEELLVHLENGENIEFKTQQKNIR